MQSTRISPRALRRHSNSWSTRPVVNWVGESRHTYKWVMSRIWKWRPDMWSTRSVVNWVGKSRHGSHVTNMKVEARCVEHDTSSKLSRQVMSHIQMSHFSHMKVEARCVEREIGSKLSRWVTSHLNKSHITYVKVEALWCSERSRKLLREFGLAIQQNQNGTCIEWCKYYCNFSKYSLYSQNLCSLYPNTKACVIEALSAWFVCYLHSAGTVLPTIPPIWSKETPPPGGFLFTMFPHQEPCVRGPPSKNLY